MLTSDSVGHSAYQALYIAWFVAGFNVQIFNEVFADRYKPMPEPLQRVQNILEGKVAEWLRPLQLSQEECQKITPNVLRAITRLIDFVEKEEESIKNESRNDSLPGSPDGYFEPSANGLSLTYSLPPHVATLLWKNAHAYIAEYHKLRNLKTYNNMMNLNSGC